MITSRSQRWRQRRDTFVPSASVIDPSVYSVDVIDCYRVARPFVQTHHYSGCFPASRMSAGLFRNGQGGTSQLVGVATFSVPMNNAAIPKHTGLMSNAGADLGRFVLLDDEPGNAETFFLSRALRLLRREKPEILAVIAYADPMRRLGPNGTLIAPGHVGQIYGCFGALHRGRSQSRFELFTPDGQLFSERAISKIRNGETGHGYAIDQLVSRGAPPPRGDPRAWLDHLRETGFFTRRKNAGNHVYAFPLTRAAKLAGKDLPALPHPRLDRNPSGPDVTALPLLMAA